MAMLLTFAATLVGFVSINLGIFLGFFAWLFLKSTILVADFFATFKFAYLENTKLIFYFVLSYYLLLGLLIFRERIFGFRKKN